MVSLKYNKELAVISGEDYNCRCWAEPYKPESKKKDHGPFNYTAGYYAKYTKMLKQSHRKDVNNDRNIKTAEKILKAYGSMVSSF